MIPILVWSLRIALLAGLTGLLLVFMRHRSAAQRNLVLRIALMVAWILPVVVLFAPRIEIPQPTSVQSFAPVQPIESQKPVPTAPSLNSRPSLLPPSPAPSRPFPWALVYGFGVGLILLRWTFGLTGLWRLRRAAKPTEDPQIWQAAIPVPATYGRTILIPEGSDEWPEPRIRAAILHERAHVLRGDWFWQTFAGGLAAIHWFNPCIWLLLRLMRDTAEAAADDVVLASGLAPSAYARELMAVAAMAAPVGPAMTMARKGGVMDRVAGILAVSKDRRTPTIRGRALLAVVLAISGIAVAGLAQKVSALKATVRLVDIRQISPTPTARWNSEGLPVTTPAEVAADDEPTLGHTPRGKRRVNIRFAVDHRLETDQIQIRAEKPAEVVSYGSPPGNGQPSDGRNDGATWLVLQAPVEETHARVRVGRATGAYHPYRGKVPFTAASDQITRPEGTFAAAKIQLTFPMALKDLDYRVFVLTDKGRVEVRDNESDYTDDAIGVPKTVYVAVDDPAHVRGVGIEARSYKETEFEVPLVPKTPLAAPNLAGSKHTIELVRLSEGDRAWLPDGTPARPLGTMPSRYPTVSGERKLTLAFRVRGESLFKPSLVPSLGNTVGSDGDWSGFLDKTADSEGRIGLVSVHVPEKTTISSISVMLKANPWQSHADQIVGSGLGQAHLVHLKTERGNDGQNWATYRLTFDAVAPIDPDNLLNLSLLDQNEHAAMVLIQHRATKDDPSYTVAIPEGKLIKRVILESQAVDRALFEAVHLKPNP